MYPKPKASIIVLLGLAVLAFGGYFALKSLGNGDNNDLNELTSVNKFKSEADFKDYIATSNDLFNNNAFYYNSFSTMTRSTLAAPGATEFSATDDSTQTERYSETNIQVANVDEPDIVKSNGEEIFFSPESSYRTLPVPMTMSEGSTSSLVAPDSIVSSSTLTHVLDALPGESITNLASIEENGNLLLSGNTLLILSYTGINAYDITNPATPSKKWGLEYKNNSAFSAARLIGERLYLITSDLINNSAPCPVIPMAMDGKEISIGCTDIYHPITPVPTDTSYNIFAIDTEEGTVENQVSFVGSASSQVIYVSTKAIYVSYYYPGDFVNFFVDFAKLNRGATLPNEVVEKIEKMVSYEISAAAQSLELQTILENYYNSLSEEDGLNKRNEINEKLDDYYSDHKRAFESTGIARVELENLRISATGRVPGRVLNQFSLDEYNGYLRAAVTIGESSFGFGGQSDSANDIYVLDAKLAESSKLTDLGKGERIYSTRFVEDKGYLVTFRQTDPFYVIDLADPNNIKLAGELKIPGYSSYLDPISKDLVLGIGKEESQVKVALFNVADPSNPAELDKYLLNEYWTDVINTHHAFLLDSKHQIFFLPGSDKGYVFSYKDNKLTLAKVATNINAKRALYINDYLYILGDDKILVLDENNWEQVGNLSL